MTATDRVVDHEALERLVGQVIADAGGAVILPLALLGDRLGLFVELVSGGPATADELAARTGLSERYLREWLLAMAAAGYLTYQGDAPGAQDPGSKRAARYGLSAEQAEVFTNPDSPGYVVGACQNLSAPRGYWTGSPMPSAPARGSAGTSTTRTCSRAPNGSSGPATWPT